ncbi:hypothetical protein QE152_g8758 [Popillia japonica]|uniref:DNA-directed RNA polymerase n=1 Tax=Popillia japonica TaxID=7064 RepID=A0AAW1M2E4_POPJA
MRKPTQLVEEDGNIAEKFNLYFTRSIKDIVDEVNIVNSHEYVLENIEIYEEYFTRSIKDIVDEVNIVNSHEYVLENIEIYEEWSSFTEIDMSTLEQYAKKLKSVGIMVEANRMLDVVNLSLRKGE